MAGWKQIVRRAQRVAGRHALIVVATTIVLLALASSLWVMLHPAQTHATPTPPAAPMYAVQRADNASVPTSQQAVLTAGGNPLSALAIAHDSFSQAMGALEQAITASADSGLATRFQSAQRLNSEEITPIIERLTRYALTNDSSLDEESIKLAIALDAEEHLLAKLATYASGRATDELQERIAAAENAYDTLFTFYEHPYRNYLLQEKGIALPQTAWLTDGNADKDSDEDGIPDSSDADDDGDGIPDAEDLQIAVYDEFLDDHYGVH